MKKNKLSKNVGIAFESLRRIHHSLADAKKARGAGAYMRNQFVFFGCDTAIRRRQTKLVMKETALTYDEVLELAGYLWLQPEREYHYAAIEWMIFCKKQWTKEVIGLFEMMITHHSWWDTVDYISTKLISEYFIKFPTQIQVIIPRWNNDDDMWLQRTSIIFQLPYKQQTNETLLFTCILRHHASKEFFIQKAIGWALRQYARTNPKSVKDFVNNNPLPALSVREAMKHLAKT